MSGVDFEALFKSPLDDLPEPRNGWGHVIAGLVTGAVVAALLALAFGGEEAVSTAAGGTTSTATAPSPLPPLEPSRFPPGHAEIAPEIGAAPVELVLGEDTVLLSFVTSVAREADPQEELWPVGGTWTLEDDAGCAAGLTRVSLRCCTGGVL